MNQFRHGLFRLRNLARTSARSLAMLLRSAPNLGPLAKNASSWSMGKPPAIATGDTRAITRLPRAMSSTWPWYCTRLRNSERPRENSVTVTEMDAIFTPSGNHIISLLFFSHHTWHHQRSIKEHQRGPSNKASKEASKGSATIILRYQDHMPRRPRIQLQLYGSMGSMGSATIILCGRKIWR